MKIGAVSMGWGNVPLQTIFSDLREMGGECVEVNGKPGRHAGLVLDDKTCLQVKQWADESGLEISGVSGYSDFAQTDASAIQREIDLLLTSVTAAAKMGVTMVRAFVGDPKPETGLGLDDFWPQIVDAFGSVAATAAKDGITVAIENHGRLLYNGARLAQMIDEVGAPNLGITLDTGNFCYAGRSLAEHRQDVAAVLPHTVNVHIKDGAWQDGAFPFVAAGDGDLAIAALIQTLADRGYSGAVCSEFEGEADFRESTRQSIVYLKTARESS